VALVLDLSGPHDPCGSGREHSDPIRDGNRGRGVRLHPVRVGHLDNSWVNAMSTLQKPTFRPRLGCKPVFEEVFALRAVDIVERRAMTDCRL